MHIDNMVLKLYFDLMSQPARAVYIFLKVNNIPFEEKPVALRKNEHHGEDYMKINPFSRVPVLDDDGFILTESVAILKYLTEKYNLADHWYPRNDREVRARIDEYMNWQHFYTRANAGTVFQHLLIIPTTFKTPIDFGAVEDAKEKLATTVKHLETYFLRDNKYICGNDITLADMLCVCELMQVYGVSEERIWSSNPKVNAYVERVKKRLQPHFDDGHKITYRTRELYKTLGPKLAKL